jgi:hypothetical protein
MSNLTVYSGVCCLCDVGLPAKIYDMYGELVDVHTGDIVIPFRSMFFGSNLEQWIPESMSVVVAGQYTTYSNGIIKPNEDEYDVYVMGLRLAMNLPNEWRFVLVKKYYDCIEGERWPSFGFSYRKKYHFQNND